MRLAARMNKVPFFCLVYGCIFLQANSVRAESASRWEPEIRAFENRDGNNPPPQDAILFVVSSSIRLWKGLAQDFPGVPAINRGFGGSQIEDSTALAGRIIVPYHPRVIVFYAGDNDLAAGKSPDQVVAEYTNFVGIIHAKLPATRIIFISIKPSPIRWHLKPQIIETNRRIAALKEAWLEFADVYALSLDAEGKPRKDLFLRDGLHPSELAYHLWAARIRPLLDSNAQ